MRTLLLSLVLIALASCARHQTAQSPEEFVTTVQKAFDNRNASELMKVTCWDRAPEEIRKSTEKSYTALVTQSNVLVDCKLVEPQLEFIDRDRVRDGVIYRPNLPVTKQLNVTFSDPKDNARIIMRFTFAVGLKDGQLWLASAAPK